MFLVSITHHSKIKKLSNENKNWKHIQTNYSAMGPTSFELWTIKTKLWMMKTANPKKKEDSLCWREQKVWSWVPCMCVYLPKYHGNSVLITWKHLKYVFSLHNLSLKNQRIENWKHIQTKYSAMGPTSFELWTTKTNHSYVRPTSFELWTIKIELWVMKTTNPNSP